VSNIDPTTARAGKWTAVEESKLNDSVQTHCDKDWVAISALVSGRTRSQCKIRWHDSLDTSISTASRCKSKWPAVEDSKLKDAVQTYGDKDWATISVHVPVRTRKQCLNRWKVSLDPSIDGTTRRTGSWAEDEDGKLKDAQHKCTMPGKGRNFRADSRSNKKTLLEQMTQTLASHPPKLYFSAKQNPRFATVKQQLNATASYFLPPFNNAATSVSDCDLSNHSPPLFVRCLASLQSRLCSMQRRLCSMQRSHLLETCSDHLNKELQGTNTNHQRKSWFPTLQRLIQTRTWSYCTRESR
jgi:hypothetical protein